jgi:predicted kinase
MPVPVTVLKEKRIMNLNELKPQFVLVIGGAGSGKNYYIESTFPNYTLIDVDAIKGQVGVGAAINQIKPAMIAAFEQKVNVAHPSTGSNLTAQENKIRLAHQYGYVVTLILVDTPVETAIKQVRERYRYGGHDVAIDKIISSNNKARENFRILKDFADRAATIRTSPDEADRLIEDPVPGLSDEETSKYLNLATQQLSKLDKSKPNAFQFLGGRMEAKVFKSPTDPSVIKIQGTAQSIQESGYLQYILMSRKYAHSNPYLPRVESIHRMPNPKFVLEKGKRISEYFVIKLEELTPITECNEQVFQVLRNKIVSELIGNPEVDYYTIDNICKKIYRGELSTRDKYLRSVLNLCRKIIDNSPESGPGRVLLDLHTGNMMVRFTSVGPQLVITDPLFNPRY